LFDFRGYTGASTYKNFALRFDGLTNNTQRIYTLPDASGTLALTSDLSGYLPLTGGTLTGALGGTSASFSSSVTSNNFVASGGNNVFILNAGNATTGWQQLAMTNTSGSTLLGVEGSTAGTLATGSLAYASILRNYTATNFQIATNNIVRATFTSAGNVGVGTTDPQFPLHILNTSAATITNGLMLQNAGNSSSTGTGVRLSFKLGGFSTGEFRSYAAIDAVTDAANNPSIALVFSTPNYGILFPPNERMRITGSGNVGIGTSAPGYTLEVAGTMYVTNTFGANSKFSGYSTDGLFGANARPCTITTPGGGQTIRFGYNDYGAGQYWGRIGFAATTNWSLGTIDAAGNNFSIGTDFRGTQLYMYTNGNYAFSGSNVSDSRKKANINYITSNQLENILKLKPASFNQKGSDGIINSNTHTGFIAQDVLEAGIANLVHGSDEDGYGLDYYGVLSLAVKAIQELKTEIDTLKNK
jgi:hypothetical protein